MFGAALFKVPIPIASKERTNLDFLVYQILRDLFYQIWMDLSFQTFKITTSLKSTVYRKSFHAVLGTVAAYVL